MKVTKLEQLRESAILLAQAPPAFARGTLYGFLLLLGGLLLWSWVVRVPLIVRAEGKIRPAGRVWLVDAETGGRVVTVAADEHQRVEKGFILMKLDPAPLQLELKGIERELDYWRPECTELEQMALRLSRFERGKETSLEGLTRYRERFTSWVRAQDLAAVNLRRKQEDLKRLEDIGTLVSAAELSTARLALLEAETTYTVTLSRHRADVERDLEASRQKVQTLEVQCEQRKDQLARQEIRAPVGGIVTFVAIRHSGQVVKPGQELFHISPDGEKLVAEVWVPAHQAGFVAPGLEARVELPTYPESIFGWVPGTVISVSPDASGPADSPSREGRPSSLYRVEIALSRDTLKARDGRVGTLRLGLQATARLVVRQERLLLHLVGIIREVFAPGS